MSVYDALQHLHDLGVRMKFDGETLRAGPKSALTPEVRALIRQHRAEIIEAAKATYASLADEREIRRWLESIGERAPEIVEDVLARCWDDDEWRAYFLRRARELRQPEPRTARQIAKLEHDPELTYAIETNDEADPDDVVLTVAIRGKGACELRIPAASYDAFALLELVERYATRRTVH